MGKKGIIREKGERPFVPYPIPHQVEIYKQTEVNNACFVQRAATRLQAIS